MINEGKKVKVHYVGTLSDGTQFDSSRESGQPLEFVCMSGMMIPGFDAAVNEMEVGETHTVKIAPEDAYGPRDDEALLEIPFSRMPNSEQLKVGDNLYIGMENGMSMPAVVVAKTDDTITFDMNHPLAGEELTFEIELLDAE